MDDMHLKENTKKGDRRRKSEHRKLMLYLGENIYLPSGDESLHLKKFR